MAFHIETPLVNCRGLPVGGSPRVRLKMECYQPTGSFKIRGIGRLCQELHASGTERFVSSSGGNAGFAAAHIAHELSAPITVVVPCTTSDTALCRLRELNAEVVVYGDDWNAADQAARRLVESQGAGYVPPFDHPLIWAGNGTLIDELVVRNARPDAIVLAVGGGGLLSGVAEGLQRAGWDDVAIIAVGTTGANAFDLSIRSGKPVQLPAVKSIASSLGARTVTQAALDWHNRRPILSVVVSDRSALDACFRFADDHQVLVEPACGAALSIVYQQHESLKSYQDVIVVVCGGVGVTTGLLRKWDELIRH